MKRSIASEAVRRGLAAMRLRGCDRIGPGACVVGRPHVENHGRIEIGEDLLLHSAPALSHLVAGAGGVLSIGDGVEIGEGAGIAAHGRVTIGDGSTIGPFTLVMDTNFHRPGDWRTPAKPRTVQIGREVRIGARVVVLPGACIGDGATIAPDSVVAGTIAAGARASGLPARPARARSAHPGGVAERVLAVVQTAFGLPGAPAADARAQDIPGWTLLGGLGLLLDLEDEFGIAIPDERWARVRGIRDTVQAVDAASANGADAGAR